MYAAAFGNVNGSERYIQKAVDTRQVTIQEMTARESLTKHRKGWKDDDKTGECYYFRDKSRRHLFTAYPSSGV